MPELILLNSGNDNCKYMICILGNSRYKLSYMGDTGICAVLLWVYMYAARIFSGVPTSYSLKQPW